MVNINLNKFFCLMVMMVGSLLVHAQDPITLRFTGQDQNGGYVPLTSVLVENVTKHWQEVLYYPDTTLFIGQTGIEELEQPGNGMRLFQNVPNPFDGVTDFVLQLPEPSNVLMEIHDLNGKVTTPWSGSLEQGNHLFRAWLDIPQTYLLNAQTKDGTVLIKMVNTGHAGQNRMEYLGKASAPNVGKAEKGNTNQPFSLGDVMLYKGFVFLAGTEYESAHVLREQYGSELIPLTFTLPLPTVTTEAASDIATTQVKLNGSVVGTPGYPVSERGFELADNAQLTGMTTYVAGSGDGNFHYAVSNLQVGTRYYYRAYAQTALGVQYGGTLFFDTQAELPEVHTDSATNVKSSRATCGGNVTYNGGAYITARGVCYSTSPNPTLEDNHTTNGDGDGSFTSLITGLTADTTYYVRAYATNSVGTAYGEEHMFTTWPPFFCGIDSVTDYDGNVYPTVEIGYQCWMKENLRTTHYDDGTAIPAGTAPSDNVAYRYAPNDNNANVPTYGYLYNWAAVMHGEASSTANPSGVQGICPEGWHVPSYGELIQLRNYVNGQYDCNGDNQSVDKVLASAIGWTSDNTGIVGFAPSTNNATGFSAVPAGYFADSFIFANFRTTSTIRSCTQYTPPNAVTAGAYSMNTGGPGSSTFSPLGVRYGHSVRCLHDDPYLYMNSGQAVAPVVTIQKVDSIMSTTASCDGFVVASGGAGISARGICWNTTPNPTVNDNHILGGSGGTGSYHCSLTNLIPDTTYYLRAYATNSVGTSYSEEVVFETYAPTACGGYTVTDYDGNLYHTLPLGQQCWLKENLRTTHYADGTSIAPGSSSSLTVPYRYAPWEQDSNVPLYGYLYNGAAVMHGDSSSNANPSGVQGICPTGWHVPSRSEWEQLASYVSSQPQYVCGGDSSYIAKALASEIGWYEITNLCATGGERSTNNATGFSALPAGLFNRNCDCFGLFTGVCYFWSSYSYNNKASLYYIERSSSQTATGAYPFDYALSVRCLRD